MAWRFDTWKTFAGTGGKVAAVLVIAGAVGLLSVPWFLRPPSASYYFTARDAAEIVGAAAERENAMMRMDIWPVDDWAPLGQAGYAGYAGWFGWFASTNGGFTTNAIGRYAQQRFFDGLESVHGQHFKLAPTHIKERRWVDLWASGGAQGAYDNLPATTDVLDYGHAFGVAPTNYPYAIGAAWWRSNIYDGATWYPFTNRHYVTTTELRAIGKAFSACRWTIEYGWSGYALTTNTVYRALDWTWNGWVTGTVTDAWGQLLQDAYDRLEVAKSNRPEEDYLLPFVTVDQHFARIELVQGGTNGTPPIPRIVRLRERMIGELWGVLTVGTNCQVYGLGRPARSTWGSYVKFFHDAYGNDEPTWLILQPCGDPVPARDESGAIVTNAWGHVSPVTAWDGLFPRAAYVSFVPGAPPMQGNDTSTNEYFGWSAAWSNQAYVIDWKFEHLTNRAVFWE
jgi:hypothetical protein